MHQGEREQEPSQCDVQDLQRLATSAQCTKYFPDTDASCGAVATNTLVNAPAERDF